MDEEMAPELLKKLHVGNDELLRMMLEETDEMILGRNREPMELVLADKPKYNVRWSLPNGE